MSRSPSTFIEIRRAVALGALVRAERVERGMSREFLARASDVSTETIRKIEEGRGPGTSFFIIFRIASSLDMTLDTLAARSLEDGERQ
jgi:transcriptional regulator with XRE-family HTH domain